MAMDVKDHLIFSASAGHLTEVLESLREGLSIDAQNSQGVTALQAAAAHGHVKVVKFLLEKSASVHVPNFCGWTPLMLAARYGHYETASILLKNNARVNVSNKLGMTSIAAAVWNGDLPMVKLLLDAGSSIDPGMARDDNAYHIDLSPVMIASFLGSDEILNLLLKKGATVNYLSPITGWSPLMLAACNGFDKTAWTLIQWGVDICISDVCGKTALDVSKAQHHGALTSLLESARTSWNGSPRVPEKSNELIWAVRDGNLVEVEKCLTKDKLAVNNIDETDGLSLLMIASMNGSLDVVQFLIKVGADIDAQNERDGWNALMQAVFYKHMNVVQFLLDNGADVLVETHQGCSVLDIAMHLNKTHKDIYLTIQAKVEEAKQIQKKSNAGSLPFGALTKLAPPNCGILPKTPTKSARLKSWLGSKTARFHSSRIKSSSRDSVTSVALPTVVIDDVDFNDDVFEGKKTPLHAGRKKLMKPIFSLCSPERYLANNLRKHSLMQEDIVLFDPEEHDIAAEFMLSTKLPPEGAFVSLQTPNLLKEVMSRAKEKSRKSREGKSNRFHHSSSSDEDYDSICESFCGLKSLSSASRNISQGSSKSPSLRLPEHSTGHAHFKFSPQSIRKNQMKKTGTSPLPSISNNTSESQIKEDKSSQDKIKKPIKPEVNQGESEGNCAIVPVENNSLSQVIKDESLQKHVKKLKEQEIDVETFKDLTDEDLEELSIHTVASRDKLLKIASALKSSAV